MTQRTKRVDELIRQEIGVIVARELSDARIGFVTITEVETTPDLSHAKVWVSFIGTADERRVAMGALRHAMPFVRHELGARLRIRRIPELHLEADDTLERGTRVLQLINDLQGGSTGEATPVTRALPTPLPRFPHDGDGPAPVDDAERTGPGTGRAGSPRAGRRKGASSSGQPRPRATRRTSRG